MMPQAAVFWRQNVSALAQGWRIDEALAVLREAVARFPEDASMRAHGIVAGVGYSSADPREVLEAHVALGRSVEARGSARPAFANVPDPARPLRVGLVSCDWREHPVAHFISPLLTRATAGMQIYVYDGTKKRDHVTRKLRVLTPNWREIDSRSDGDAAALMRKDGLDVAIDLGGHTLDSRVGVMAHHGAPVQVTYLGYASTTAMPSVGWRMVDSRTDPAGAERWSTEKLLRMDPCFLCFTEPADAPEVVPPPCVSGGVVTFGSFNNLTKVTPATIGMWAGALARVPRSRLMLKGPGLDLPSVRERVVAALEAAGVARDRVTCLPMTAGYAEHVAAYAKVDIALDTFPYHGTTTTCEALWMGVPVVTLAGELHASRVGVSVLNAAGLGEWVAETPEGFAEIAARLAADTNGLSELRAQLRERVRRSPLGDAAGFVERFEAALRVAWGAWCSSGR